MSKPNSGKAPSITVAELEFSDGSKHTFSPDDIVVVVGPNNAGKSAMLRAIRDKVAKPEAKSPVLRNLTFRQDGSAEEFATWIESIAFKLPENSNHSQFEYLGLASSRSMIALRWDGLKRSGLQDLARWMCHFLSAGERLEICKPPKSISFTRQGPVHPIHHLQRYEKLEAELSDKFRQAFSADLVVHRMAGADVPLYVGERPSLQIGEDRLSFSFVERIEMLSPLIDQGDGMQSFAGVLLASSVGRETIMLIDEPEAFLHPPQARLLGTFLAERRDDRQLFVATHSTDVLKGVLNANSPNVKVIRICRDGDSNLTRLLDNNRIKELWSDPLLRYSNILDGLFHEVAVICEGDSDCRFYSAMIDAMYESGKLAGKRPDVFFTHCGGKGRLPLVVRALREVDVPVRAVADFDVLSEKSKLQDIFEALGGTWSEISEDWKTVCSSLSAMRPTVGKADVKVELDRIFTKAGPVLSDKDREQLTSALRRTNIWSMAKAIGKSVVPAGNPSIACNRLLQNLSRRGLHVVEVGELEGFCRTIEYHGPKWVNDVLHRDLAQDAELENAREFTKHLVDF